MLTGAGAIEAWFAEHPEIQVERVDERGWLAVLPGERRRTVPVYAELGARDLTLQSFFIRAPDENQAETYALLLRRHLRSHVFRFALTDAGDVLLIGYIPSGSVTVEEFDVLVGQLLTIADEAFDPALRMGFASYIEREQQWRAAIGAPRNPIT